MTAFSYEALRRYPDVEAANLFATDASDRLLLDEAAPAIADAAPGEVVIIGDRYGALTLGAAALHSAQELRVHQDALSGELALANNAGASGLLGAYRNHELGEELLAKAKVVLLQVPRQLSELDEFAEAIARHADQNVTVFAGGRIKHMTPALNEVLRSHFGEVRATLARQKSRVLVAHGPIRPETGGRYPLREYHADPGIWVCASGGVFAGTKIDIGTRFLLEFLPQAKPDATAAVDLGCGTGVLAAALATSRPDIVVRATDQSAAAVRSARATMEANGVRHRVSVVRDDALALLPDESAELILCNPPFHIAAAVHAGGALKLFEDAARVLRPGGELWIVFNTHLAYRAALGRLVGATRIVGRNAKFSVAVSTRN
ncbi:MAG: class I SAM-dependent methyltransferase [Lacisediminihabitans sp.]